VLCPQGWPSRSVDFPLLWPLVGGIVECVHCLGPCLVLTGLVTQNCPNAQMQKILWLYPMALPAPAHTPKGHSSLHHPFSLHHPAFSLSATVFALCPPITHHHHPPRIHHSSPILHPPSPHGPGHASGPSNVGLPFVIFAYGGGRQAPGALKGHSPLPFNTALCLPQSTSYLISPSISITPPCDFDLLPSPPSRTRTHCDLLDSHAARTTHTYENFVPISPHAFFHKIN
jgi:hypothetical protein